MIFNPNSSTPPILWVALWLYIGFVIYAIFFPHDAPVKSKEMIAFEAEIAEYQRQHEILIRKCAIGAPLDECRAAFECVSEPSSDPWVHSDDHQRY